MTCEDFSYQNDSRYIYKRANHLKVGDKINTRKGEIKISEIYSSGSCRLIFTPDSTDEALCKLFAEKNISFQCDNLYYGILVTSERGWFFPFIEDDIVEVLK